LSGLLESSWARLFLCLVAFLVISSVSVLADNPSTETGSLKILIDGFSNDKGSAMLALYDSKDTFTKSENAVRSAMAEIKGGKAEVLLKDLPFGTYAIKVFHDENGTKKLDTTLFGIPKQKYGFSNNARGVFGPATWAAAHFSFNQAEMTMSITVKHYWG
jgi:uncharacterized protein (DUF2141 family)